MMRTLSNADLPDAFAELKALLAAETRVIRGAGDPHLAVLHERLCAGLDSFGKRLGIDEAVEA